MYALECIGLIQHVDVPTNEHSRTLDLVITRQFESIVLRRPIGDRAKSTLYNDEFMDWDKFVSCYNSTLSSLVDRHASLQSINVVNENGLTRISKLQLEQEEELNVNGEQLKV